MMMIENLEDRRLMSVSIGSVETNIRTADEGTLGGDVLTGHHEDVRRVARALGRFGGVEVGGCRAQRLEQLTEGGFGQPGECRVAEGDETVDLGCVRGNEEPPGSWNGLRFNASPVAVVPGTERRR